MRPPKTRRSDTKVVEPIAKHSRMAEPHKEIVDQNNNSQNYSNSDMNVDLNESLDEFDEQKYRINQQERKNLDKLLTRLRYDRKVIARLWFTFRQKKKLSEENLKELQNEFEILNMDAQRLDNHMVLTRERVFLAEKYNNHWQQLLEEERANIKILENELKCATTRQDDKLIESVNTINSLVTTSANMYIDYSHININEKSRLLNEKVTKLQNEAAKLKAECEISDRDRKMNDDLMCASKRNNPVSACVINAICEAKIRDRRAILKKTAQIRLELRSIEWEIQHQEN